jgi:hypothetical protein
MPQFAPAHADVQLWPTFPGFEAAFGCKWRSAPVREFEIDGNALDVETRDLDDPGGVACIKSVRRSRRCSQLTIPITPVFFHPAMERPTSRNFQVAHERSSRSHVDR